MRKNRFDILALANEVEDPFDGAPPQAPPLAADLHLDVARYPARQAKPPLELETGVKPLRLGPFVEEMTVDQALFLHPRLDPIAVEIIEALDVIHIGGI